jgi:hypothetical protein
MELNALMKRRAGLAIENTYTEYSKEGGVADLEARLAKAHEGCSKHIFNLATFIVSKSDDLADATAQFAAVCVYAEAQLKEKHQIENVKDALPVWGVYKSNILRGMKLGLDPTDHATEGAFRAATMDEVRARGPQAVETEDEEVVDIGEPVLPIPVEPHTVNIEEAEMIVEASTIVEPLKGLVARLVVETEYIRPDKTKEAARILSQAIDALHRLVDVRKIEDAATREALHAPQGPARGPRAVGRA